MQRTDKYKESEKFRDLVLIEDLERRYGPAMAQEILDQLKKAENPKGNSKPADYFSVKALSEGSEIYRREAQTALKRLKAWKNENQNARDDVVGLEGIFLQREFEKSFSFFLRFNRGYHVLYRQAMEAYKVRAYAPYKEIRVNEADQTTIMSKAA
jgi:hypothetical protein